MPVFPLATVACTVSAAGISAPSFADILASFQASVQAIYGTDIYIDPDSKDGQFLAALAQAQSDSNQATIAAYNSYNPQTALGAALDGAVKVNSIRRQASSASSATVTVVGQAGTLIYGGVAQDVNGNLWDLPAQVLIPPAGQIDVTATAELQGNIVAPPNTINQIQTVVLGWQSVTNAAAAVPGAPVELDGALRERQASSTANTAATTLSTLAGNVAEVAGVSRSIVYQNDTNAPDANGIPAHNVAVVVLGGNVLAVATAIQQKKDVGAGTYGTTSQIVVDPSGVPININFFALQLVPVYQSVSIHPLPGYTAAIGAQIQAALAAFVSGLAIGQTVYVDWCEAVAGLTGAAQQTFVLKGFAQDIVPNPVATADIAIAFNQAATLTAANVAVVLV